MQGIGPVVLHVVKLSSCYTHSKVVQLLFTKEQVHLLKTNANLVDQTQLLMGTSLPYGRYM